MAQKQNLKLRHPPQPTIHIQPLAGPREILARNPLQLCSTLYMCRDFLGLSILQVIFYSQRPRWTCTFDSATIDYFRTTLFKRCARWYQDALASFISDKYITVTRDERGNVVVTRTEADLSEDYNLMPVALTALTYHECSLDHLMVLAILRFCRSNNKPPWGRKKFTRYMNISATSFKRYMRYLIRQGLASPYKWKIYKPFGYSDNYASDEEYFSARNVYHIRNKPRYVSRYRPTKKAVININDWPLLTEQDRDVLLQECAILKSNHLLETSQNRIVNPFGNFWPPLLNKAKPYERMDIIEGGTSDRSQALRSPYPIFTSVMDSLTRLESSGFLLMKDWRKQPETYRSMRWLARQEGVTEERVLAWERELASNSFLKAVLRHGWKGAIENDYAKKGSAPWNKSAHLAKYRDRQWRVKHLIYHFNDIIAGKYQRKELSEKAKGRVWGEECAHTAPNTPLKRPEINTEWFKDYLMGLTIPKYLRTLLGRLWDKYGWSAYETLIDPCEIIKDDRGRWVFEVPNGHHADLMEARLNPEWWRIVRPKVDKKAHSPLREAYAAWLKENERHVQTEKKDGEGERVEQVSRVEGEQEMGIVPANDDEGIIPAYVEDDTPYQSGQMPRHMGGRAQSQDMAHDGRESEEALLKLKKERQEQLLRNVTACTNMHTSERSLRAHTIAQYGIAAYQCWFDRCWVEIEGDAARYVAPSDFIGYEIERRYGVILESYTAKGEEIAVRKKKEKM